MPCDCELDLPRRWVKGRAWGIVTYDEIMTARRKFITDSSFSPDFNQIYDGRDVTKLDLTASQIVELAKDNVFGAASRRAFVAPSRETYRMMRLFQNYRELNAGKEQIKLFRTLPEAEAWLTA